MKDIRNVMKQAQEMQARMVELQERLKAEKMEASAGGGMVTAVVNGRHELLSVKIRPQVVDPSDVEMLEDLVLSAVNEAHRLAEERIQTELSKVTGGLNLPGLF